MIPEVFGKLAITEPGPRLAVPLKVIGIPKLRSEVQEYLWQSYGIILSKIRRGCFYKAPNRDPYSKGSKKKIIKSKVDSSHMRSPSIIMLDYKFKSWAMQFWVKVRLQNCHCNDNILITSYFHHP